MATAGKWNNARQERFQESLLDAFPCRADLEQLVYYAIDVDLDAITSETSLQGMVFTLLRWARARGKLDLLLEAARKRNGDNPLLRAFAEQRAPFFVPFSSDSGFVGRNAALEQLDRALKTGGNGFRRVALVGMGGVGKTQLAVEYVHRHRSEYPGGVYWVNAAAPLVAEISGITERLGLRDEAVPEAERPGRRLRAFEDHLADCPEALVIFDNVADPLALREPVAGVLLWDLPCHLLFTTRRRDPDAPFVELPIGALSEDAALSLLLSSKTRRRALDGGPVDDIKAARAICGALGHLPLAIVLASAYLAKSPSLALGDYLLRLRREGGLSTADAAKIDPLRLPTQHTAVVAATLRAQWDALATDEARRVLKTAALFRDASHVPRATLAHLTGLSDEAKNGYPAPLEQALSELSEWSLVEELTRKGIRLHPLVRDFAAERLENRDELAATCAKRLGEALRVEMLDAEVRTRGLDAILSDLRLGEALAGPDERAGFHRLLRVLDREAHCLRRWQPPQEPGFFLQQIRNVSFELGIDEVRAHAEAALRARGLTWLRERVRTSRESDALVRTLAGHTSSVWGVTVMPDGRSALSASHDHSLKIWEISSGCEIRTLAGHTAEVNGVAVTPDGGTAISASSDGTLKVWDLEAGREMRTLSGHCGEVTTVAVTPDGHLAVSASSDCTLRVWEIGTGRQIRLFAGHEERVNAVAVTSDGRLAVSASEDATLRIWEVATGRCLRELAGHTESVMDVAVTSDGRLAISASADNSLKVWELSSGRELRTLAGHQFWANGVAVTPNGLLAVSASSDNTLKVWDIATGREVHTLKGHAEPVKQVAVTPDGRLAISASVDQTLKVWELVSSREAFTDEGHSREVSGVAVTPDGRFAISASHDETLRVWDLSSGAPPRTLKGHSSLVMRVAVTPDGRFAVSASEDWTLRVWDLLRGRDTRTLVGHTWGVAGVAVCPDGKRVISASGDKTLKIWDLASGREIRTLAGHTSRVTAVATSPDGNLCVSASEDRTLRVWDMASGREIMTLTGHGSGATAVAITPDGLRALSASEDATLRVWDLATGRETSAMRGHNGVVTGVAISPDGGFVLSVSEDTTLRVWDLDACRCIGTLEAHAPLLSCAVGPDGRTFVVGDVAGSLHVIDWICPPVMLGAEGRDRGLSTKRMGKERPRYGSSASQISLAFPPVGIGHDTPDRGVVSTSPKKGGAAGSEVVLPDSVPVGGRLKILFLASNPISTSQLQLSREARQIEERLGVGQSRDTVQIVTRWAVRRSDLVRFLLEEKPHVLHFSGHGTAGAKLLFEDDQGNPAPLSKETLTKIIGALNERPRLVVLNACETDPIARSLTRHVDCAIGMREPIRDEAAISFAVAFYQAIALQQSVATAFELARTELMAHEIPAEQSPGLKVKRGLDAARLLILGK